MWYPQLCGTTREQARQEYERLYRQGIQRQWMASLFGRTSRLLELDEVRRQAGVRSSSYGGMRTVPIAEIRGTEGRSADFDSAFRPLQMHQRERWASIAECRGKDVPLPAVDLVQVGNTYFVRDGHHRISVARQQGQLDIEAEVTVWQGARLPEMKGSRVGAAEAVVGFWQLPVAANHIWARAVSIVANVSQKRLHGTNLSPQSGN